MTVAVVSVGTFGKGKCVPHPTGEHTGGQLCRKLPHLRVRTVTLAKNGATTRRMTARRGVAVDATGGAISRVWTSFAVL
jgi:hypothetical protein